MGEVLGDHMVLRRSKFHPINQCHTKELYNNYDTFLYKISKHFKAFDEENGFSVK
jgi:hypothetical protein